MNENNASTASGNQRLHDKPELAAQRSLLFRRLSQKAFHTFPKQLYETRIMKTYATEFHAVNDTFVVHKRPVTYLDVALSEGPPSLTKE